MTARSLLIGCPLVAALAMAGCSGSKSDDSAVKPSTPADDSVAVPAKPARATSTAKATINPNSPGVDAIAGSKAH